MNIDRRVVLKLLAAVVAQPLAGCGSSPTDRGVALSVRTVDAADAANLQAIMTSSVCSEDAFFGQCGEWSIDWATDMIARCPDAMVLVRDGTVIAFLEIPPIRQTLPALPDNATDEERESYAVRDRNRSTFRVTAAGIRDDLLSKEESIPVFLTLLHEGFVHARDLGFASVEAIAPWGRHPRMAKKWTDYPGCTLVEPVSYTQGEGADLYWLQWALDDAIAALAAEGAGTEA